MKTKHFYLCLLLLVLGTANVWADKYYQPWSYKGGSNPRFADLASMVGQKFMIYNAAIAGNVDRSGFLYNAGTKFGYDKTKERDLFIYNEKYVYTLEEATDANGVACYAIKSITSGTYVAADGSTAHSTPQYLYIKDWKSAGDAGWARSGANAENYLYSVIGSGEIASNGNVNAFVVSSSNVHVPRYDAEGNENANYTIYWNGEVSSFTTYTDAHPYTFYRVSEIQNGDYLEDLHIFSRSDLYSAQVIWGYIQNGTQITISPDNVSAANTALLIDGDLTTGVSTVAGTGSHYFQFNLGKEASNIYLYMQRSSADGAAKPTSVKIQGATAADGPYTDIETLTTGLDSKISYTKKVPLNGSYSYIRVVNATADAQMALSEIYILPVDTKTEQAFTYFDKVQNDMVESLVYNHASAKQYEQKVAEFNESFPEAKTLSGVPLAGNKYRIYADAYNGTSKSYVNKEISLGTDGVDINPAGSYHGLSGDAAKKYEWYCEETVDGKLVFRNVYAASDGVEGDLYLANNGTVSSTPYKWSMSTVQTSRHGVPLWGENNKYLAIANDGSCWVPDVKAAQNQEVTSYTYQSAGTDTPDDTTDDVETTIEGGICTDFVFIPVEVLSTEKKITFTANEIVKRNTVFTFNGVEYKLPFSRMFTAGEDLPKITLKCEDIHKFNGVYEHKIVDEVLTKVNVTGTKASCENGVVSFKYDAINDADVLELKLTIGPPFKNGTGSGNLYLIRNLRRKSVAQQAPSMPRRSATNVPIEGGQIATSEGEAYYAQFAGVNENITLFTSSETVDFSNLKVEQFFYFNHIDVDDIEEYYKVNIGNVLTPNFCQSTNSWTSAGETWYVQPNVVGGGAGYAIGLNVLDGTIYPAAPDGAWCSNHTDGDKVVSYHVNDAGALWEFIPVPNEVAITKLKDYIADTSKAIQTTLQGYIDKTEDDGIDNDKSLEYKNYAALVVTEANAASDVATLVGLSHDISMLNKEIEYALVELPMVTDRSIVDSDEDYSHPNWYYIYNVESMFDNGTTPGLKSYAKFTQNNVHMALDSVLLEGGVLGLENMFYLEGTKITETVANGYNKIEDNNLTIDEYLQVDIHNFMTPGNTLVSRNDTVLSKSDYYPGKGEQYIAQNLGLVNTKPWRITLEYDLENVSYNAYGTCLLAGSPATYGGIGAADDNYAGRFQVYLKDDKSVVIKLDNSSDQYRFWHTQDKFSHLKVIITYNVNNVILEVINSDGSNGEGTPGGGPMTLTHFTMNDIDKLSSALPADGAIITNLSVERIEAHRWLPEDDENDNVALQSDTWYVLPSSNTTYPGYSIVAGGANDANFGWTNFEKSSADTEIFSASGNDNNSTWQFEKILEFDAHAAQLLEKYAASNCVIYNEELARLVRLIKKNASYINAIDYDDENTYIDGHSDEYFFNEIYAAIKDYDGPMPDELKAPKPGKFYTVRPAYGDSDLRLLANEYNTMVQKNSLEEVIDGNTHRDSRIAWFFDGTEENGFYKLDDALSLNSLHTQSNTNVFAADSVLLDDVNAAPITLVPVGGCIVRLNDGTNNLRHKAMGDSILLGNTGTMSYGYASTEFERTGTEMDGSTITATSFNEFNEILLGESQKTTVAVTSNYAYKATYNDITAGILCPNVNGGSDTNTSATTATPIELTFTYTNLPASFTSFNSIGLDIHALNGGSKYQQNADKKARQWNIAVSVSTDGGSTWSEFGSVSDIDIAAGIGQSEVSVHKVWNIVKSDEAQDFAINGSLVVKLTIQKGTTNNGCFFGLSNIILSAEGDTWYIEEIPDGEKQYIYHETLMNKHGRTTLMLGYDATVPDGLHPYYPYALPPAPNDKFVSMRSYDGGIVPANTPVMLKLDEEPAADAAETYHRFYYSTTPYSEEISGRLTNVMYGSLYTKVYSCQALDDELGDCNIYMFLRSKKNANLYWIYEECIADGTIPPGYANTDKGRHIQNKANRAFYAIPVSNAGAAASLLLRFDNGPTTGIEDIYDDHRTEATGAAKGIFDLQGRKLHKITAPGMYIVDGEKVLVE